MRETHLPGGRLPLGWQSARRSTSQWVIICHVIFASKSKSAVDKPLQNLMCGVQRPSRENDASADASSIQARQKQEVEQELSNISGLNYVIVRPALVYGLGDRTSLSAYICISLHSLKLSIFRQIINSDILTWKSHGGRLVIGWLANNAYG